MSKKLKVIIASIGLVVVSFVSSGCTEGFQRDLKTTQSEWTGGLNRHVSVYSDNGNLLKEYDGQMDVEDNEYGGKVLFDLNGKRTIVYGGTVIVEEK